MLIVSAEMFETMNKRALEIAEEQFRRLVFDTNIWPEAAAFAKERVIEELADSILERWANAAR